MAAGAMMGMGAVSAYGSLEQGKMTSQSLNNQANNLDQQASEAESQGQFNATRQQISANRQIGAATASYGASGVSATSGSVMDVLQASHQNSEMDRLNILHGADIKAVNYENQASMDRFGGASALQGSYFSALGGIAGGVGKGLALGAGGPGPNPTNPTGGDEGPINSSIPGGGPGGGEGYYSDPSFAANLYGNGGSGG